MVYISDKARDKVALLKKEADLGADYFLRVGVVGGGCSGLSYQLHFDNEAQPDDQVFEDNSTKVVTDGKSYLYLCDTVLEFSDGINGKGFQFINPNASRTC